MSLLLVWLEVENDLHMESSRCYEMCARKTRKKIIQGNFVEKVHYGYFRAYAVAVFLPEAVRTDGNVKNIPWLDAGWIGIGVVGSGRNDVNESGAIAR